MSRFIYSAAHLDFLRAEFPNKSIAELAAAFNRKFKLDKTVKQIHHTVKNHKIYCHRKQGELKWDYHTIFTPPQAEFLRSNYPLMSLVELTKAINNAFNLDYAESQVRSYLRNHKIRCGRTGYFESGRKSWNKDTKGLTGANSGSFKKGIKAHNWRPIGSERVNTSGYIEIKTCNEPVLWEFKHLIIWKKAYGAVAKGFLIRFRDGDPSYCELDNLMIISKGMNSRLNVLNYNQSPEQFKPTMMLIAQVWEAAQDKANN